MITDTMITCACIGPASQTPILITAPLVKKTNLHERFHAVTKL